MSECDCDSVCDSDCNSQIDLDLSTNEIDVSQSANIETIVPERDEGVWKEIKRFSSADALQISHTKTRKFPKQSTRRHKSITSAQPRSNSIPLLPSLAPLNRALPNGSSTLPTLVSNDTLHGHVRSQSADHKGGETKLNLRGSLFLGNITNESLPPRENICLRNASKSPIRSRSNSFSTKPSDPSETVEFINDSVSTCRSLSHQRGLSRNQIGARHIHHEDNDISPRSKAVNLLLFQEELEVDKTCDSSSLVIPSTGTLGPIRNAKVTSPSSRSLKDRNS